MSRQQFAFAIGFAVVAVWTGVAGFMIARVLDGQVDVGELMDRIGAGTRRSPR
jgi:predicted amino acid dehydrogenase